MNTDALFSLPTLRFYVFCSNLSLFCHFRNTVESIGFEVAIHLHRRTHYYLYNVLVPIMTLSLLTLANIRIPARYYQDKVFMGLSTFIAQSWYLIMISPELPVTQMHLPLIGRYNYTGNIRQKMVQLKTFRVI